MDDAEIEQAAYALFVSDHQGELHRRWMALPMSARDVYRADARRAQDGDR